MELADRLQRGVERLRAGDAAGAAEDLRAVTSDPHFAAATDMDDVRASAWSLLAQASLESGAFAEADRACRESLRILRRLGDPNAMHEVRGLQDRIVRAIAEDRDMAARREEAAVVAATPVAELLSEAATPEDVAAALVKKANALLDSGAADQAADLAYDALARARAHGLVTWEVFARLALLRADADHADEHLRAAHELAAGAQEFNLIATIARAADLAGLALPLEAGPHLGRMGA